MHMHYFKIRKHKRVQIGIVYPTVHGTIRIN